MFMLVETIASLGVQVSVGAPRALLKDPRLQGVLTAGGNVRKDVAEGLSVASGAVSEGPVK